MGLYLNLAHGEHVVSWESLITAECPVTWRRPTFFNKSLYHMHLARLYEDNILTFFYRI